MTVHAEPDEVAAAQRGALVGQTLLGHVADPPIPVLDGVAEQGRSAGAQRMLPQNRLQQARLARAVRPEHRDELALGDG